MNPAFRFHFARGIDAEENGRRAQERAAVVLAAAGCPLTSPAAEESWRGVFRRDLQGSDG